MANQRVQDMEVKDKLSKDQLVQLLHQWLEGIENRTDFYIPVKGQQCFIPADAIDKARIEVEYEVDKGEYELELQMKWR